jgi:hypothetical protein
LPKKSIAQTIIPLSGLLAILFTVGSVWDHDRRWQWIITAAIMLLVCLISAAVVKMERDSK